MVNSKRIHVLNNGEINKHGPVVYWMSRDQRVSDNWALLFSISKANELKVPLHVVFSLTPNFLNAGLRHYSFMLHGLKEVEEELKNIGIAFNLLYGNPESSIPEFVESLKASILVSDFDPLKVKIQWKHSVNSKISIMHLEVDAHNVVPCRIASQKVEFGAHTIRTKINKLLGTYLVAYPDIPLLKYKAESSPINWNYALNWLKPSPDVTVVDWITPGETAAINAMNSFLNVGLAGYSENRNNPLLNAQSGLSPYLHFGQLSAQRLAVEVAKSTAPDKDKSDFLDELIVRRELSDNFCLYNENYDNVEGFHSWAKKSLAEHSNDEREYIYSLNQFEKAQTHDNLWNAAQQQMVKTGKMHGYMRMYWAKKILEWTISIEEAMRIAIYLNDKYSLDGRDPNGYAGIAWSIGGVHDRAWAERPVFGKVRYMNYNGCKRKFDVEKYISIYDK